MGRPTARGPPIAPREFPPEQPPPAVDEYLNFIYQGQTYSIPQSVYNEIQELSRTTPDLTVLFELIGRLLIPYGYVPPLPAQPTQPPPPPSDYLVFTFNNVNYSIPRIVWDEIQRIQAEITDAFQLFRAINILLVPYGAPPIR